MRYLILSCLLLVSCRSTQLLPSSYDESVNAFDSYSDALQAYNSIGVYKTTKSHLKLLGFDTEGNNVETITYLDVSKRFLHNDAINKNDLPKGVLDCLKSKGDCQAYLFKIESLNKERYGSFWADISGFRKKEHHTGWKFNALILIVNDTVLYKLHSGISNIDKKVIKKHPLGPLQDIGPRDFQKVVF